MFDDISYAAAEAGRLLRVAFWCSFGNHRFIGRKWPAQCAWCERWER